MRSGEGNGTPLQYFCLENPMDGGAWLAAVHGVARVGHDWATSLSPFIFMHWRRKWQPTPVFLLGESQGREAWWAAVYGVAQSQIWLKWLSSSSSRSFLIDPCIFSILFSRYLIIFTTIILNYFSDSLSIFSSFFWTLVFLVCSLICVVLLCLFIKKKKKKYCVWGPLSQD